MQYIVLSTTSAYFWQIFLTSPFRFFLCVVVRFSFFVNYSKYKYCLKRFDQNLGMLKKSQKTVIHTTKQETNAIKEVKLLKMNNNMMSIQQKIQKKEILKQQKKKHNHYKAFTGIRIRRKKKTGKMSMEM